MKKNLHEWLKSRNNTESIFNSLEFGGLKNLEAIDEQ